jgi:hypothetical protein
MVLKHINIPEEMNLFIEKEINEGEIDNFSSLNLRLLREYIKTKSNNEMDFYYLLEIEKNKIKQSFEEIERLMKDYNEYIKRNYEEEEQKILKEGEEEINKSKEKLEKIKTNLDLFKEALIILNDKTIFDKFLDCVCWDDVRKLLGDMAEMSNKRDLGLSIGYPWASSITDSIITPGKQQEFIDSVYENLKGGLKKNE